MLAASPDVRCPHCRDQIVKSYADGETKLRAALLKWNGRGFFAVCKSCKQDVQLPFDLLKSIQSSFSFEVVAEQPVRRRIRKV